MKYKNRFTGEIKQVVKEEEVCIHKDKRIFVTVYELDDGSRWQSSQFHAAWIRVE